MLFSRRAFCLTAVAGLSLDRAGAGAGGGATAAVLARQPIVAALYDSRCPQALRFAEAFRRRGAAVFVIERDSMELWHGDLGKLIVTTGGSVAGFTTRADFVIARSCGRELSLRGVFEERLRVGEPSPSADANRAFEGGKRAPSMAPIHLTAWLLATRTPSARGADS
jgi:hypothetical protein